LYKAPWLAVLLLVLYAALAFCDPLDDRVSPIIKDLEYLSSRGVDVSNVTRSLDAAIRLYEANRTSEAMSLLDNVSSGVQSLKATAEEVYLRKAVARYSLAALVLSLPLVAYLAIPRVYVYVWFRLHRGWLVEKRRGGGE